MKQKSTKLLLWAIFLLALSICIRVLYIGYETPNLVIWISFILPVIAIFLAGYSLLRDYLDLNDNE